MALCFRKFPADNVVAYYWEAPGGGDVRDINSLRNRPAKDPLNWLANVKLHSWLDYFEVSHSGTTMVSHAGVGVGSVPPGATIAFGWGVAENDHLLLTHNLGYPPFAFVAVGNNIIWPGMPVQVDGGGGGRYASVYCTSTQIRLFEWASAGGTSLAATNLSYQVLVFKQPPGPVGNVLYQNNPTTGAVTMARGKIDTSRRYLSVVPGGTPFGFPRGRTIDLANGAPRAVLADGTIYDPVPAGLVLGLYRDGWPQVYGASLAYNGSFTGSGAIMVQAP